MVVFTQTLLRRSFASRASDMLKRIQIQHLTLGMYLHELCGSWMEHPFWRAKFLLQDPKDLARIQATSINECWIDTDKGVDVAPGTASVSRAQADAQFETDFSHPKDLPPLQISLPLPPRPAHNHAPTDMEGELQLAASIGIQAKKAVVSMFNEARLGKAVDTASAQQLVQEISDSVTRNPGALISLARLKTADDYTYMHSVTTSAAGTRRPFRCAAVPCLRQDHRHLPRGLAGAANFGPDWRGDGAGSGGADHPARQGVFLDQVRSAHSARTGEPGRPGLQRKDCGTRGSGEMALSRSERIVVGLLRQSLVAHARTDHPHP